MSRLGASFERSTVYQVREQARLDLATGRRKSGAARGRERAPPHAQDVQDASIASNGGESGDWDRQYEEFRARAHASARGANRNTARNGSSLHGAVTGIDYTSRPVTPAHSDMREQDLWHRPELVDDDRGRGATGGGEYGERPSTAAAFGNADDGGDSISFDPKNQKAGSSRHRRKSGMERDGQSAHQRQRRRNERRREKKRLAEAKAASGGQAPNEIRRHAESASSWSWAQGGSGETDAEALSSSSISAGRKEQNQNHDSVSGNRGGGSVGAKQGDTLDAEFEDHDEEAHRELAASAARWKPIVSSLSSLVPKLEMAAAMAGRQIESPGKGDPLLPVAEEIERRVAAAGSVAVELLDQHKEEVKLGYRQQQRNGPGELDENCRAMLFAFSAVRKRILKAYHSLASKLGKGERVRLQVVLCRVMFRMVAVATALDVCYPGASSFSSAAPSSSAGSKKAFAKARARRLKQLQAVARSLFGLSKNKSNDAIFREEGILHSLLELLSGEESSTTATANTSTASSSASSSRKNRVSFPMSILVYTTGTLRNICVNDDKNQKVLAQQGAITTLTDMLNATAHAVDKSRLDHEGKRTSSSSSGTAEYDVNKQRKNMCQLLVFITGCIRCLFKPHNKRHFKQFWGAGTVEAVCRLLREFEPSERESDLTMNCVRLLSNFSLQSKGRDLIVGRDRRSNSLSSASAVPGAAAKTMKALIRVCAYSHAMSLAGSQRQEGVEGGASVTSCSSSSSSSSSSKEQKSVDHDAMLVRTLFVLGNLTAGAGPSADANRRDIANAEMGSGIDGLRLIGRIISSRAQTLAKSLATANMVRLKQWEEACDDASEEGGADNATGGWPSLRDICATREIEEVIVKSVRTLANLSLAPEIGKRLARDAHVFDALLTVLNACASVDMPSSAAWKVASRLKRANSARGSARESKVGRATDARGGASLVRLAQATREELLTNVVSALSNISFYCTSHPHSHRGDANAPAMISRGQEVSRVLISILLLGVSADNDTRHMSRREQNADEEEEGRKSGGDESTAVAAAADRAASEAEYAQHLALECARVFGNFSRSEPLRQAMRTTGADAAMILLLEHDSRELVYSACGVLVNLAVSVKGKKLMLKATDLHPTAASATAVDKLLGVIRDAGLKDLPLVTLACRALYNLCLPASLPVEMAARNTGRNTRAAASQTPQKRGGADACADADDDDEEERKTSAGIGNLASAAAAEAAATAALAAAVQITVPIPPRLLGSLIGTLDELEAVASDIIEEADEEDADRSDYDDEEEDGYASVRSAREFVSVVRPLLTSLEEQMEAVSPAVTIDGATGYEGKQDHHRLEGEEDKADLYDDLEPLPEERPEGLGLSGRHAKK